METIAVLLLAIILDLAFGEPPNRWHPVAWLGRLIAREIKPAPRSGRRRQYLWGAITVILTVAAVTAGVFFLLVYLRSLHPAFFIAAAALLLKLSFSLRGLAQAALRVKQNLIDNKTELARLNLRALVSRDTAALEPGQVITATVASVAENICDSFTAPLLYFAVFGVPGAVAYRVINTFDAMVGYRGEYEYPGKFAARLDDVANYLPARLTALFMVAAAWFCRRNVWEAWGIMRRDHHRTASPNGGWTMSAAAGALGLQIEKPGHYRLGDAGNPPEAAVINRSVGLVLTTATIWCAVIILIEVIRLAVA
jgi:adenosylcobinamide-phosphate synthase